MTSSRVPATRPGRPMRRRARQSLYGDPYPLDQREWRQQGRRPTIRSSDIFEPAKVTRCIFETARRHRGCDRRRYRSSASPPTDTSPRVKLGNAPPRSRRSATRSIRRTPRWLPPRGTISSASCCGPTRRASRFSAGSDPRGDNGGAVCCPRSLFLALYASDVYIPHQVAVNRPCMTNTLLTLHDPAAARRYYAEGLWRDDTLYTLLQQHAAQRPEAFALRDATRRLTWRELLARGRCGRGRSRRGRAEARRAGGGVAAEPGRGGRSSSSPARARAMSATRRCTRTTRSPRSSRCWTRTHAAALFAQPGYGADARTRRHLRRGCRACPRCAASIRSATARAGGAVPDRCPRRPAAGRRQPGQDRLSRVHLGHDRHAERRHAFRQHLLANARAMVEDWHHDQRTVLLSLSPLSPSHRHRGDRAGAGGRAWSWWSTRRRRARPRSTGSSRPARPMSWACRPTRWTSSPRCAAAASTGSARSRPSTWPARRSRARWRRPFSTAASPRKTSTA